MNPAPAASPQASTPGLYKVGTLTYTRGALIAVLFWMLWADLGLQIMEQLPNIIPVQLKSFGADNKTVGLIRDSMMHTLAFIFVPMIGMQSDRHRSRMGRRRPFILWSSFPVLGFLVLLGFAAPIARWAHSVLSPTFPTLSAGAVGIGTIAFFTAGFFFFNNYTLQVYQYLFADVIPTQVMGTFIGFYRAVGAVAMFAFNRWVFGFAKIEGAADPYANVPWVYLGCGLLYFVAFFLLVLMVKEGEYPPVDPTAAKKGGPIHFIKTYAVECYSHSFYLKIFTFAFFFWAAWVPFQTFVLFFATKTTEAGFAPTLGLTTQEFGQIKGWTFLPQVGIFLVCGFLVDMLHPLRVLITGTACMLVTFWVGFFWIGTSNQLLTWWIVNQLAIALVQLGYLAMFPALFPKDKYGQFFSANQIFFSVGVILSPILCGWMLDSIKDYRYVFIWAGVSSAIALVVSLFLFAHWKRLGGDKAYAPPQILS